MSNPFQNPRGRPAVLGSGMSALVWPQTGQVIITRHAQNTIQSHNWRYRR